MLSLSDIAYPIAELGNEFLLIHNDDRNYLVTDRSLEIKCVLVNLDRLTIDDPFEIELHLKFNPWEEIMDENKQVYILNFIQSKFSNLMITERIIATLEKTKIKHP
ncbi:MAG: hypothetical protein AAB394_03510 [Patescibacteria group bacterium]